MNRTELVKAVAEKSGLSHKQTAAVVENVFSTIVDTVAAGESVAILGFGTFEVKNRPAREGRNSATGEKVMIPAAKVPGFRAGKGLKDAVK